MVATRKARASVGTTRRSSSPTSENESSSRQREDADDNSTPKLTKKEILARARAKAAAWSESQKNEGTRTTPVAPRTGPTGTPVRDYEDMDVHDDVDDDSPPKSCKTTRKSTQSKRKTDDEEEGESKKAIKPLSNKERLRLARENARKWADQQKNVKQEDNAVRAPAKKSRKSLPANMKPVSRPQQQTSRSSRRGTKNTVAVESRQEEYMDYESEEDADDTPVIQGKLPTIPTRTTEEYHSEDDDSMEIINENLTDYVPHKRPHEDEMGDLPSYKRTRLSAQQPQHEVDETPEPVQNRPHTVLYSAPLPTRPTTVHHAPNQHNHGSSFVPLSPVQPPQRDQFNNNNVQSEKCHQSWFAKMTSRSRQQQHLQHQPAPMPSTPVSDQTVPRNNMSSAKKKTPQRLRKTQIKRDESLAMTSPSPSIKTIKNETDSTPKSSFVFRAISGGFGLFDSIMSFSLKFLAFLILAAFVAFLFNQDVTPVTNLASNEKAVQLAPEPSYIPPCFIPSVDTAEFLPMLSNRECNESELVPCPDHGVCSGGFLHECEKPFFVPSDSLDACIPTPASVKELEELLINRTQGTICNGWWATVVEMESTPTFQVDPEYTQLFPYLEKSTFVTSGDEVGFSVDYIKHHLPIPMRCWGKLFITEFFLFMMKLGWTMLATLLWTAVVFYPVPTIVTLVTICFIQQIQKRRKQRQFIRKQVALFQEMAYIKLQSEEQLYQVSHLRDTIAYDLHPMSLKDRKHVSTIIWPKVVSVLRYDTRIRRVQKQGKECWEWVGPRKNKKDN